MQDFSPNQMHTGNGWERGKREAGSKDYILSKPNA
jgi:hypothetical protein